MSRKSKSTKVASLPCACANLRRASRAVTQLYEEEMRGSGVRATQFPILLALSAKRRANQRELGEVLGIDNTTLSRTLRPLLAKGWIRSDEGEDRRERVYELTANGRRVQRKATTQWERAQRRLRVGLGDDDWQRLEAALVRVTGAAGNFATSVSD